LLIKAFVRIFIVILAPRLLGDTDKVLHGAVSAGVAWSVRTALGNPQSVRVTLGYTGSRQHISPTELDELIGHGVQGLFKITGRDLRPVPEPMGSEHRRMMHRFGITANAGYGS
jgi:hypothetical protein